MGDHRRSMKHPVRIELRPLGRTIDVERGTALRDVLYAYGVEFPCGGNGRCKRCRVQLLDGVLPISEAESTILSDQERQEGWRLACRCRVEAPVTLQVEQFRAPILVDHTPFAFQPRQGHGVAVDLGTTTLVAQLLDLETGRVLAAQTALNPQGAFGSDIMQRTEFALEEEGRQKLTGLVRDAVEKLVRGAVASAGLSGAPLETVVLVGNTVMHHLFCGLDVKPLAAVPFESEQLGVQEFRAEEIGWNLGGDPRVRFLPCLGGFVGSDVLAGVLATRMHETDELMVLVDLGTNGEIVVGNADLMLCTSTAAGPAFEAGGIEMGMQATTGAIDQVVAGESGMECRVLGGGTARGLCGSGLVDAVAAGLELGWIEPSGRLANGRKLLPLDGPVHLTQRDIRQLQLAKGAIAAGLKILLERVGVSRAASARVNLAGAFGNYVNRDSARRIGLLDYPSERVEPVGNTALLGAKLALFAPEQEAHEIAELSTRIEHVSLAADPTFHEVFIDEMRFPG
jgi:uncharacterized 2Fe-2S/4Fe-4S cluster protein (DUF4445 family)